MRSFPYLANINVMKVLAFSGNVLYKQIRSLYGC